MNKRHLLILALFGAVVSTTACKKCQTCTHPNYDEMDVCREGIYNTPQLYNQYIKTLEDDGYDCK